MKKKYNLVNPNYRKRSGLFTSINLNPMKKKENIGEEGLSINDDDEATRIYKFKVCEDLFELGRTEKEVLEQMYMTKKEYLKLRKDYTGK